MNETSSLDKTIETILIDCHEDILEFLVVVCGKTSSASLEACEKLRQKYGRRINVFQQKLPYLGGAMRDAFSRAKGSHVLMMASDLETPPGKVKDFIAESKEHPTWIITGSRWIEGGGFKGYSKLKYLLNFLFQRLFSILYRSGLTDMTYGYRLFPTYLVQNIRWEELRYPFLFETIIKPLRLGVKVKEIPIEWEARREGSSQNAFMENFLYFGIGVRVLFYSRKQLLKEEPLG